ncbi:MAG: hypothetical protein HXX20_08665 [Chloroflexi bacterium]|nr:hypothetical protein [Chloroflexota bacterium]
MQTIKLQAHIGIDGILRLELPLGLAETDLEVLVIVQPMRSIAVLTETEKLGWPPGFFEQTYGSLRDETLIREPQGEYEVREELLG